MGSSCGGSSCSINLYQKIALPKRINCRNLSLVWRCSIFLLLAGQKIMLIHAAVAILQHSMASGDELPEMQGR